MTSTTHRRQYHPRSVQGRMGYAAAISSILCAVLTSCSSPSVDEDVSAVGENGSVGDIDLLSILLVASEEGGPGRLLGTVENESDQSVEVTISDADDQVMITVPAQDEYRFEDNETVLTSVEDAPGAMTTITATTTAGTTDLLVPVHDGTLERFRPYLPD